MVLNNVGCVVMSRNIKFCKRKILIRGVRLIRRLKKSIFEFKYDVL